MTTFYLKKNILTYFLFIFQNNFNRFFAWKTWKTQEKPGKCHSKNHKSKIYGILERPKESSKAVDLSKSVVLKFYIWSPFLPSYSLRRMCPNTELFWSVFSCNPIEYGDLLRKSSYSVWMQENTDQKKLRIWTLFTQWLLTNWMSLYLEN